MGSSDHNDHGMLGWSCLFLLGQKFSLSACLGPGQKHNLRASQPDLKARPSPTSFLTCGPTFSWTMLVCGIWPHAILRFIRFLGYEADKGKGCGHRLASGMGTRHHQQAETVECTRTGCFLSQAFSPHPCSKRTDQDPESPVRVPLWN